MRLAVIAVVVALIVTGCGKDTNSRAARHRASDSTFEMAAVISTSSTTCQSRPLIAGQRRLPLRAHDNGAGCIVVGPPVVTGADVESATLANADTVTVNIRFTRSAIRRVHDFTTAQLGHQVALIFDGTVVSAPIVQQPLDDVVAVGGLTLPDARRLVGALSGGPNAVPTTQPGDADLEHAQRICDEHRPAASGEDPAFLVSSSTAGDITNVARQVTGQKLSPWDRLPPDHFVARCSYGDVTKQSGAPTTVCPNGDVVELTEPQQYIIDDQGTTTNDIVGPGPVLGQIC